MDSVGVEEFAHIRVVTPKHVMRSAHILPNNPMENRLQRVAAPHVPQHKRQLVEEVAGVREYVLGDPLRRLHWKKWPRS